MINYEQYFKINSSIDNEKIDLTKFVEYDELKTLILQCDKFLEIYSLGDKDNLRLLDYSILKQSIDLICKIIFEYGELNDLTREQLRKYYGPLKNRVLFENLYVDIYVPILFTKIETKEYKLTESISIVEMSDEFQKSRSEIESFRKVYQNQY